MRTLVRAIGPLAALLLCQAEVAAAAGDGQPCRAPSVQVARAAVDLVQRSPLGEAVDRTPSPTVSQQVTRARGLRHLGSRMATDGTAASVAWAAPVSRWLACVV